MAGLATSGASKKPLQAWQRMYAADPEVDTGDFAAAAGGGACRGHLATEATEATEAPCLRTYVYSWARSQPRPGEWLFLGQVDVAFVVVDDGKEGIVVG